MCCGKSVGKTNVRKPKVLSDGKLYLRYKGNSSFVVRGKYTGKLYEANTTNRIIEVHLRDYEFLLSIRSTFNNNTIFEEYVVEKQQAPKPVEEIIPDEAVTVEDAPVEQPKPRRGRKPKSEESE